MWCKGGFVGVREGVRLREHCGSRVKAFKDSICGPRAASRASPRARSGRYPATTGLDKASSAASTPPSVSPCSASVCAWRPAAAARVTTLLASERAKVKTVLTRGRDRVLACSGIEPKLGAHPKPEPSDRVRVSVRGSRFAEMKVGAWDSARARTVEDGGTEGAEGKVVQRNPRLDAIFVRGEPRLRLKPASAGRRERAGSRGNGAHEVGWGRLQRTRMLGRASISQQRSNTASAPRACPHVSQLRTGVPSIGGLAPARNSACWNFWRSRSCTRHVEDSTTAAWLRCSSPASRATIGGSSASDALRVVFRTPSMSTKTTRLCPVNWVPDINTSPPLAGIAACAQQRRVREWVRFPAKIRSGDHMRGAGVHCRVLVQLIKPLQRATTRTLVCHGYTERT